MSKRPQILKVTVTILPTMLYTKLLCLPQCSLVAYTASACCAARQTEDIAVSHDMLWAWVIKAMKNRRR